jgi:hypothetical protein
LTSVTEFRDPGSLHGRSSPAVAAAIKGAPDALPAGGLAFDGNGNLWMANADAILMYSDPHALTGTVDATPAITLKVTGKAAPTTNARLMFFPQPVLTQDAGTSAPDAGTRDSSIDAGLDSGTAEATDTGTNDFSTDGAPDTGTANATGNFTFSNVVGSNGDSTQFSTSCCGTAAQNGGDASNELLVSFLSLQIPVSRREIACDLWGPLMVGATYTLTNAGTGTSNCKYSETNGSIGGAEWISNGGTLTVDTMTGKTFTVTLHAATMVANSAVMGNAATGTFSLDGMGTVTLP